MSTLPPLEQPPAPAPTRVPVITVIGILVFALGAVLARVLRTDADPTLGEDVGEIVRGLGVLLASFGGALPPAFAGVLGRGGGKALTALIVAGALAAVSAVTPGCAALQRREVHARTAPTVIVDDGPPCTVHVIADGHEVSTVVGPPGSRCPTIREE